MSCFASSNPRPQSTVDASELGRPGRIECYLHSDAITHNKGGAMVKVTCVTDFAARTSEFILFVRQVAKFAYASSAESWADIVAAYPSLTDELEVLTAALKERIAVVEISVMKL